jgi:DNA repair protein RadC
VGVTELVLRSGGGRRWWAHLAFTPITVELAILQKEIEELMNVKGIGEKSFLKLKPLITVGDSKSATHQ